MVKYDTAFGKVWFDGLAEMSTYTLTYPRYAQERTGTAVAITVTEPFDPEQQVKADRAGEDTYGVIKLNLIEDFQTGIYDYNLMTSVFVATEPAKGMPAGSTTKVSFSSQEWCGHVYQQANFGKLGPRGDLSVKSDLHSYFQGQADRTTMSAMPDSGMPEDALFLWARGLAGPTIKPGQTLQVPVYRSLAIQRLTHKPPAWDTAVLAASSQPQTVETPAGSFECDIYTADITSTAGSRRYTFYVDRNGADRKLVKLTRSDGYSLELVASDRLPYWQLNGNQHEEKLDHLELKRRGELTM
jgi:hypothetical protein